MKHEIQKLGEASKLELNNLYKFILYLYGRLKCKKMTILETKIAAKKVKSRNLGTIPHTIRYVDSLSIFDTYVNPYKNYELSPKKKPVKQKQKDKEVNQEVDIISISNYQKPSYEVEDQKYKPAVQEVQDIQVDDDIGIDGIVDFDLDDFLDDVVSKGTVEKKTISDPYRGKQS